MRDDAGLVFEDPMFRLQQSRECAVPGYLVLRVRTGATSMAELDRDAAGALGAMLARVTAALERTLGAGRVYCLSFCEVERRLHFHLFPRTDWLLDAFRRDTGAAAAPVDGPALFAWARTSLTAGTVLPAGAPEPGEALAALRAALG